MRFLAPTILILVITPFAFGQAEKSRKSLTVANFFEPLTEDNIELRGEKWPERMFFTPAHKTLEEAKELIFGTFQVFYHCGGQPLAARSLADINAFDGYYNNGALHYYLDTKLTTRSFPPSPGGTKEAMQKVEGEIINGPVAFKIEESDDPKYPFVRYYAKWAKLEPIYFNILEETETKEIVIEKRNPNDPKCTDGTDFRIIEVPLNLLN